jgi:hypothetical protein
MLPLSKMAASLLDVKKSHAHAVYSLNYWDCLGKTESFLSNQLYTQVT